MSDSISSVTPAAPAPPGPPLHLRPTMLSDLDFVAAVEMDQHNLPFISPWERTQHEGSLRFPDFRHFIVEAGEHGSRDGFVILQGCRPRARAWAGAACACSSAWPSATCTRTASGST